MEPQEQISARFHRALDSFIEKAKPDPNVIAVILEGSLAYDKVWHKSDIDVTVLIREQKIDTKSYCIGEDNLIVNVALMAYSDFKRMLERGKAGSFTHSLFARAKVVYTAEESLYEFLEDAQRMGEDDIALTMFTFAGYLIGSMAKVEKWLAVRENPQYAQFYLLKCAEMMADMYLILRGIPNNRESVLTVREMEPEFIAPFYDRPMSGAMSEEEIRGALAKMRGFLEEHAGLIAAPALRELSDGELRTVTTLVRKIGLDSHSIYHVFDFLGELGLVDKVSETIRITPKSRKAVEEVAFIRVPEA